MFTRTKLQVNIVVFSICLVTERRTDKSNFSELGSAIQSDLRTGMIEFYAVDAGLSPRSYASIVLPLFITRSEFDFDKLTKVTKEVVYNLNKILDNNIAQLDEVADRNTIFRAIGLGVHGLADVFAVLRMPYDSIEAKRLNVRIAETLYYASTEASCELAEKDGAYPAFRTSPLASGTLQYEQWNVVPSTSLDWGSLKTRVKTHGVRNALIIAIGPSSQNDGICGFSESVDPPSRCVTIRRNSVTIADISY